MSAFSRAVAVLHANADVSVACTWHPGWTRDAPRSVLLNLETETYTKSVEGLALRGVRAREKATVFSIAGSGTTAPRELLDIAIADVPAGVERGDLLIVEGSALEVEEADVDTEGVTWRITLSDA
jgi:hypothetical protein